MSITNREVIDMAGRDGTGPMGSGAKTGRGLGPCGGGERGTRYGAGPGMGAGRSPRRGRGCPGFGAGFGRGVYLDQESSKTDKEFLTEQKEFFEERINNIKAKLEDL